MNILKTIEMKCGQAYVLSLGNNKDLVEVGDVYLPNENEYGTRPYRYEDFGEVSDKNKRVITICTMLGCYFNCQFCASRRSYVRNLTKDEILGQVDFLISQGKVFNRSIDPNESKEFHVLYTRMGEPFANIDNVISSIYELVDRYPHIKIGLSTCGWEQGVLELLKHPNIAPNIMMQFSVHGTDEIIRSKMLGIDITFDSKIMDMRRISKFIKDFRKLNQRMVSLNFILLKGVSYDFIKLREVFDIQDVYIRLSPLNITGNSNDLGMEGLIKQQDVIEKKPLSSEELKYVMDNLDRSGFRYAYAPAIDEEIKYNAACGQALEILRKEKIPDGFYN